MKKSMVLFVVSIENLKTLKYHTFSKKKSVLLVTCSKCEKTDEKIKKSIEILETLD